MKNVDYIVVGQGFAGVCLSFRLLLEDKKVVVIDNNFEKSSTLTAAGLMNPIVFKRLTKSWRTDELIQELKLFYPKLEKETESSFFKELPIAKIFSSIEEQNDWELKKDNLGFNEYLGDVMENPYNDVSASFGFGLLKNSYVVSTEPFLFGFKNYLEKGNAILSEKFNYNLLKVTETYIEYKNIKARSIIFCEGSLYENNPFFSWLPFKLTKGEIMRIKTVGLTTKETLNKGFFMMPDKNNEFKVGATYEWDDLSYDTTEKGKKELLSKISTLINCDFKILEHKAGVRPTVRDRKPILGVHPKHKNLYVFNGLGTKGGLIAPLASKWMVKFLIDNSKLPEEVSVERFYSEYN